MRIFAEKYAENVDPKCRNGMSPLKIDNDPELSGLEITLLGRKCVDNFCPAGTVCRQMEFFAHCCNDGSNDTATQFPEVESKNEQNTFNLTK